jgi:hypothetical protein
LPWIEGLFYDARFALRGLRRDPVYTLAALAMLALAIGLNVIVFAIMNTMLFRGFPFVKRSDRLIYIQERYPSGMCCISYLDITVEEDKTESEGGHYLHPELFE